MSSMVDAPGVKALPYALYDAVVRDVAVVTPRMKRIAIAASMVPRLRERVAAQAFKVFVPDGDGLVGRMYTVRDYDKASNVLIADFVLHGPAGAASHWAEGAVAGTRLRISDIHPRVGFTAEVSMRRLLLFGDETAVPAIASIVTMLPRSVEVEAFIEIADVAERQDLSSTGPGRFHWLARDGFAPGTANLLAEAAKSIRLPASGHTHVWAAAETQAIKSIRRTVRDLGLPAAALHTAVYWRYSTAEGSID